MTSGGAGSLQRTLTLSVVGVVGLSLAVLSTVLYLQYRWLNRDRFDERLAAAARTALALIDDEGVIDQPDAAAIAAASLDQSRGRTYLRLWREDGTSLPDAAAGWLPPPARGAPPSFSAVRLPDGTTGRLYQAWLPLRVTDPRGVRVGIAVARDASQVEARITRNGAVLLASTLAVVLLAAAVASRVVRRSLRDVSRLSASIGAIDASSLDDRLELHGLPAELRPPFVKLNELLARVASSLARERQFSADVSHELRTPLAGLRAILEVSMARERPAPEYRASLGEALEVVHQLEAIVEDLILLARLGAGQGGGEQPVEPIRVRDLVEACFAPYAEAARRRELRFEVRVPPELTLETEKVKLRLIVANLLSNAVAYTAAGGWISVESDPGGGVVLAVRDSGPPIPEASLSRVFDPFFRLDSSRSGGGEHCGVGLALVRGLCDALGYGVEARNEPGGVLAFVVSRPADGAGGALAS